MSKQDGRMITCDRCGATVFVKKAARKEADGGFTTWDVFEKADGWTSGGLYIDRIEDLCDKCSKEWESTKKKFFHAVEEAL